MTQTQKLLASTISRNTRDLAGCFFLERMTREIEEWRKEKGQSE